MHCCNLLSHKESSASSNFVYQRQLVILLIIFAIKIIGFVVKWEEREEAVRSEKIISVEINPNLNGLNIRYFFFFHPKLLTLKSLSHFRFLISSIVSYSTFL